MTNFTDCPLGRVYAAEACREGIELSAQEVADLINEIPTEEEVMDRWLAALEELDVKALKISKKAQQAIAQAFELSREDLWR